MTDELSPQEDYVVNELLPATSKEIADDLGVTVSYVWDIAQNLRRKGLDVSQNSKGEYFVPGLHESERAPSYTEARRMTSESKATKTRKAKKFLTDLEAVLQRRLEHTEPATFDGGIPRTDGSQDLIIPRSDDHFGQVIINEDGNEVFNSEIAEQRVQRIFDETMATAEQKRAMGVDFDAVHLLLLGDIVTNEAIYDGQAHEIDENIQEQIARASRVYTEAIAELAESFPYVQVIATGGNHGEFRTGGASQGANADDILYDALDLATRSAGYENVQFVQSKAAHYVNGQIRGWNVHMRHGHDASLEHIGTSAGKQRWQQWLLDHDFDVAFRGHYHNLKEEPVDGVPVYMAGTIVPQSGYEESMAMGGRPAVAIHGATDVAPTHWTRRVYLG